MTKETACSIPLIEGRFSPGEASEIIETIVDERVRLHNIQMLRMWEGNHKFDSAFWDKKIQAMKAEKELAKDFIAEARKDGYKVEIVSTIEVRISKPVIRSLRLEVAKNMELSNN